MAVEGDAEPVADDGDRERLREVVEQVHAAGVEERLQLGARQLLGRLAHRLDAAGRERGRDVLQLDPSPDRPARAGRILGLAGLFLAASAVVALGVYGLLEYVGSR